MRKHIILAAIAALASFTACSNEEEEEPKVPGNEVTFTINGPVTRATTDVNSNTTTFQDGDKVAIYSKGLYIDLTGQTFTVKDAKLDDTNNTNPRFNASKPATFYAFYPAEGPADGISISAQNQTSVKVTVSADQSGEGSFDKNDFMVATCTDQTSTSPNIDLKFNHKLSLIKVDVSDFADDVTINAVQIEGVKTEATWTYGQTTLTASGTPTNVKMGNPSAEKPNEYWAIVPAQSCTGIRFLLTSADNKLFAYTLTDNKFEEGKIYSYTMKMNLTDVSASVSMENQWGTGVTNDNAVTDRELRTLIQATGDVDTNLSLQKSGNWSSVSQGWGVINTTATISNNQDGWFEITVSSAQWYQSSLTYRTENINSNVSGKYQISFTAKGASNNTTNQLKVMVLTPYETSNLSVSGNNCYFKINNGWYSSGYGYNLENSEEKNVNLPLDLSYWKGSLAPYNNTETKSTAETFSQGIVIAIGGTLSETYYIKNLSIVEVE